MKRTIKTTHDVVQVLIDIIAEYENQFAVYTQYFYLVGYVKVTIVTKNFSYTCEFEPQGPDVHIKKYKNNNRVNSKIRKACIFKVYDNMTCFVSIDTKPVKTKVIFI